MSNNMKAWAHAYAKIGWPVFRITGHKTPLKGSHGHLDATTDPATIDAWWTERPGANLAGVCGDIVVLDADGPTALQRLLGIAQAHGGMPRTAVAQTSRGAHFYFRAPAGVHVRTRNEPRTKSGDDGIDIKAHGGWTVLPPSVSTKSGFKYKWLSPLPIAELPMWLLEALTPSDRPLETHFTHLGTIPEHLKRLQIHDVTRSIESNLRTEYTPAEHARLVSALTAIPITCGYDDFLKIGMALKELEWDRSDGISISFDIWNGWCAQSEFHNEAGLESKWNSFKRSGVTVASIYHMARQCGWNGGAPPVVGSAPPAGALDKPQQLNGHAGPVQTLPAAFLTPPQGVTHFPDINPDTGLPKSTCTNAGVAITAMGISCRKDLFHEKMMVGGQPIQQWAGDLSDDVVAVIRKLIRFRFGFDPNKANTTDACIQLCLEHQFDPVCDYLDSLRWDGWPRLDTWMQRYLSAADTELNRTIGRLALVAAVRRARSPGTKFDQIIVLEGVEGKGKSTAIEIMAGRENFSDQKILGLTDKEQQEAITGIWLYEIAELTGMRRAETDHVKAFASRTVDRARPAYGRFRVDRPRRAICFATTNDDEYLKSETGNRRFWPVVTGSIDLEKLKRDRDQVWAEAASVEARGGSIGLPERLWAAAGEEQDRRKEADDWFEKISNYIALKGLTDVTVSDVLCDNQFIQRKLDAISRGDAMRAGAILKRLRFVRYHKRIENGYAWRYRRMT